MRVAVITRGLTNPLAFMWPEIWVAAGHDVSHVDFAVDGGHGHDGSVDLGRVVLEAPGSISDEGRTQAEALMGGRPDVLFVWWGTGSMRCAAWARAAWPSCPAVLCVDTFPNASRPLTEFREVLALRGTASSIDGLLYFSEEMRDLHRRRAPALGRIPDLVTVQPIPDRAFARDPSSLRAELRLGERTRRRACFTGRADYLFSSDRRMAKDALGPILDSVRSAGVEVWVQDRGAPPHWRTYPHFTTAEILDGTFATYLSQFDAQLALYRQANATLRRRVRCGLSSRFGLGPASAAAIVVPVESAFARRIIEPLSLGIPFEGPERLAERIDGAGRGRGGRVASGSQLVRSVDHRPIADRPDRAGRRMKVALVHSRYLSAEPSGENAVVDSEAAALTRGGIDARVFQRASDDLVDEPLRRTRAAVRVATGRGASPVDEIAAWGADIVHVHNLFPNFGTAWVDQLECPVVHTVHNFRPVCANGILFRDGHYCDDCLTKSRWAGLAHRCYRDSFLSTAPISIGQRRPLSRDRVLAAAAAIIVLSERTRAVLIRAGLPPGGVHCWPNFIGDDRAPRKTPQVDHDAPFVFVGRLTEAKGILRLMSCWPSGHRLVVVGDGPDAGRAREAARGRPDIDVLGHLDRSAVPDLIAQASGLVIPSLSPEQFPMVYLEAIAAGTPVLAFDTNSAADLVASDGTGVVCGWGDDISSALDRVKSGRMTFSSAAASALDRSYSESRYLQRATALYSELIARRQT